MQKVKTTIDLTAIIYAAATLTKKVKVLQQIDGPNYAQDPNDYQVVEGQREVVRYPELFKMTKEQFAPVAYELLKSPAFARSFVDTAKALSDTDFKEQNKMLGQVITFRTREVAQILSDQLNKPVTDATVQQFRYAIMNIVRDEAARYSRNTKGDHFEAEVEIVRTTDKDGKLQTKVTPVIRDGKKVSKWVIGQHTDFHVAKGLKDEPQVFVQDALSFLDNVLSSKQGVSRSNFDDGKDSLFDQKAQAVYVNEDQTELLFAEQEKELAYILGQAGFTWQRGETTAETFSNIKKALDELLNASNWNNINDPEFHLDRLMFADQLQRRITQIDTAKHVAHEYNVGGNRVKVGITNAEIETRLKLYAYVVEVSDFNAGEWQTVIYEAETITAKPGRYDEVRYQVIESLKDNDDYRQFCEMHGLSDVAQLQVHLR